MPTTDPRRRGPACLPRGRRRAGRAGRLATACALAIAACVPGAARAAEPADPGLTWTPCALHGVEHPAACATLRRHLDPSRPGGASFELHVAIVPALARNKKPDPVFFLAGGPGQSAIELAGPATRMLGRFLNRRDLVLIDQRGTGRSAPLSCDFDESPGRPLRAAVDAAAWLPELARCRQALQQLPHGDLRQYTTVRAMQDVEAVRQALGAQRINLVGVSYGTRAALEYLRQFPRAVRRVVLDGVAPPDMALPASFSLDAQAAFGALLAWCRADAGCQRQYPELAARWASLKASLPRTVRVTHPVTGRDEELEMTAETLASLVRLPLYVPFLASALPAAIDAASRGNWSALAGLSMALGGSSGSMRLAQGMHYAVVCSEDLPLVERGGAGAPDDFGDAMASRYRQACRDWPRGEVPPEFYVVGPSASPVLLLSGGLDPATPPRHAHRVAASLGSAARALDVPNAGHGVLALPCVRDLVFRFVDDAEPVVPDAACLARVPRPPVFRPPGLEAPR